MNSDASINYQRYVSCQPQYVQATTHSVLLNQTEYGNFTVVVSERSEDIYLSRKVYNLIAKAFRKMFTLNLNFLRFQFPIIYKIN